MLSKAAGETGVMLSATGNQPTRRTGDNEPSRVGANQDSHTTEPTRPLPGAAPNSSSPNNPAISSRYAAIRAALPPHVTIVLAAKTRTVDEVREVVGAGATDIGYNYVQEAVAMKAALGEAAARVRWHLIGHLQTNKITRALQVFDTLQTIDTVERAEAVSRRVAEGRQVPVLLEINVARETNKSGFAPESGTLLEAARRVAALPCLALRGLMTMGPADAGAEELRPFFRQAADLLMRLRDALPDHTLDTLSMGMSDSYLVAVEEGATMVRLGTVVFGERASNR